MRGIAVSVRSGGARQLFHDLERRWSGPPRLPARVCRLAVVCAGNICRSPLAERLLERALPELEVGSFGLATSEGRPADPRACRLAQENGLDLSRHRTRPLNREAVASADLVLVMDARQAHQVERLAPARRDRVLLLGDFSPGWPFAIPDPYGGSDARWRSVWMQLVRAVEGLTPRLRAR
jgi:protein-tyrosine phosphatase